MRSRLLVLTGLLLVVFSLGGGAYLLFGPAPFPPEEGALIRLGTGEGPVLVEFSSFSCPHCRRYWAHAFPPLYRQHLDPGAGPRYAVRHLARTPGDSLLNRLAYCAYRNWGEGGYLAFREGVLSLWPRLQPEGGQEGVLGVLMAAGVADEGLSACAESPWAKEQEERDLEAANRLLVSGTPTFFLGRKRFVGYRTYPEMLRLLAQHGAQ